ncbi:MAG: rhodanese-like domain-containing protein [Raoultibacter sp.]
MVESGHKRTSILLIGAFVASLILVSALIGCFATPENVSTSAPSSTGTSLESLISTQGVSVISPEQTRQVMEQYPAALLIDVRESSEYAQGHIPGAFLVPLGTITSAKTADEARATGLDKAAQEKGLASAKDASALVVYCRSGVRSAQAAQHLASLGFSPVLDAGGINSWPYEIEK